MMIPILIDLKVIFKDLESFHVWGVCVLNQNFEIQKYLKFNNLNSKDKNDYFNIHSKISNPVGINAMSISNISGIPRGTVFRKLQLLVKKNFLHVDKKKLYNLNIQIDEMDIFYKLNSDNVVRLSVFINKLLNLTNVFK